MSTITDAFTDSATMLRRSLRHEIRYPVMIVASLGVPIILLLLFTEVFGGAFAGTVPGRYIDFVLPGILIMMVGYGCSTTALAVNKDMTEGIIARFRTMPIARASVLTGHVIGAVLRSMITAVLVVGVAVALGFRSHASAEEWLAAAGVLALLILGMTWLSVGAGLAAKNPEGTTSFTLLVQVLPFVSSAFVNPQSMHGGVRWFAENEPFTPIIDTLRGLLLGGPIGHSGVIACAWCVGFAVLGYVWSRSLFNRDPAK